MKERSSIVTVVSEVRFGKGDNNAICCFDGSRAYAFWSRYLSAFDLVRVVARVSDRPTDGAQVVCGPNVTVLPLPDYYGPEEYLSNTAKVRAGVRAACGIDSTYILRVPGHLSWLCRKALAARQAPYAVEVLGDPYDVFAPGAVKHPLRRFFRWNGYRTLRRLVHGASATAYVTEVTLQRRYPASRYAFSTHYSSVELPASAFRSPSPCCPVGSNTRPIVVAVGRLAQLYKGTDVMIEAVAHCAAAGVAIQVLWVGDGPHRPALERLAEEAGVTSYFHFLGQLRAGDEVRQVLDQADLFVMPSRTEGLPRALIEAMARGLPCIGSDVGGIPELLPAEDLVPAGNAAALAEKIASVLADGERRARMSARNLQIARGYESSVLEKRRREFFNKIRDLTNRHYRDLQEL